MAGRWWGPSCGLPGPWCGFGLPFCLTLRKSWAQTLQFSAVGRAPGIPGLLRLYFIKSSGSWQPQLQFNEHLLCAPSPCEGLCNTITSPQTTCQGRGRGGGVARGGASLAHFPEPSLGHLALFILDGPLTAVWPVASHSSRFSFLIY